MNLNTHYFNVQPGQIQYHFDQIKTEKGTKEANAQLVSHARYERLKSLTFGVLALSSVSGMLLTAYIIAKIAALVIMVPLALSAAFGRPIPWTAIPSMTVLSLAGLGAGMAVLYKIPSVWRSTWGEAKAHWDQATKLYSQVK